MSDQPAPSARLNRVVVGTDGSEQSVRALDRAVLEAQARKAELEILCGAGWSRRSAVPVTDSDGDRISKAAAEVVDRGVQRAREAAPELTVRAHVDPDATGADALVKASHSAALTVVGTRGRGGFTGLLVGSVSLRAAAHSAGPLMVVGNQRGVEDAWDRRATLVGVRSEIDEGAIRFGFEEARRTGGMLRVLHAWQRPPMPPTIPVPPAETAEMSRAAKEMLRRVVAPLHEQYREVEVKGTEQSSQPAAALIEASRTADLVVVTAKRRSRPRRLGMQLSTVVHAVLHHAYCPVVVIPAG